MGPVPVLNKPSGEFPVGAGRELYPDGRVAKVDPVADVPREDLSCLCKALIVASLPTSKNPAGYRKSNFAFLQISHRSPPTASRHGSGLFVSAQAGERSGRHRRFSSRALQWGR